jgi:hypothetical protein
MTDMACTPNKLDGCLQVILRTTVTQENTVQLLEISLEEPNRWIFVTSAAFAPVGFVDLQTDANGRGLFVSEDFAKIPLPGAKPKHFFPNWPHIFSQNDFAIPPGTSIASCVARLDAAWQKAGLGLVYAEPSVFPANDQAACLTGTCEFHCHLQTDASEAYCKLGGMTYFSVQPDEGFRSRQ